MLLALTGIYISMRNGHWVGLNYQPTQCPLIILERFSAYPMSIIPESTICRDSRAKISRFYIFCGHQ